MLAVVVLIWGAVIYQLIAPKESFEMPVAEVENLVVNQPLQAPISLDLSYGDPFLKGRASFFNAEQTLVPPTASPSPPKAPLIMAKTEVTVQQVVWPNVTFTGTVNEEALVMIGNRGYIVKQEQEVSAVKFLIITKDSIKVRYQEEEKVIYKKKF